MFDIQELNDMVYGLLGLQDLAQCARVSKKWHTTAIPYLWEDLACLSDSSVVQRQAFTTLLLEDYLSAQQQGEPQRDDDCTEHHEQAQPPTPSALAKYGCWIRILPDPKGLVQLSYDSIQQAQTYLGHGDESTEQELLLHLFKRCHTAQLSHYSLEYYTLESGNLKETIAQLVLPRVRHLSVRATYRGKRGELWKLKRLLGRCSTTLEKLTLDVDYQYGDSWSSYDGYDPDFNAEEEDSDATGSTEWPSLKELILYPRECVGTPQPAAFWSWFFKRCSQVERLRVSKFRRGAAESIAKNMWEYMPHLSEITVGHGTHNHSTIKPERMESLLSGSRNGWKAIVLMRPVNFMTEAMDPLRKHFATLEVLRTSLTGFRASDLVEVLSSCPNLRSLCSISSRASLFNDTFVDRDPSTGALKTWSCETSLKAFHFPIGGIPRPGLERDEAVEETQLDRGREIQGLVYDRLARLTNLEKLSLGDSPEEDTSYRGRAIRTQYDCLEMSLESGLDKLSGLTRLKELNVLGMMTRIGIKEVQWMTKHWPRLRILRGLDESEDGTKDAVLWLQEHHPEIDLTKAP